MTFTPIPTTPMPRMTPSGHYASAPGAATLRVFGGPAARVVRTNVDGRFATVRTRGAIIEAEPLTEAVLLEHFSFGWQAIQIVNRACAFDEHRVAKHDRDRLMLGMPRARDDRQCGAVRRRFAMRSDSGPQPDVDAIRTFMIGPLVPSVTVYRDYALADWYGGGGGETFFRRSGGAWRLMLGGGGAFGVDDARRLKIPTSAWCPLEIFDARCPPRDRHS